MNGAIEVGELHFAGPVPDEDGFSARGSTNEYMRKHGVFEVIVEKECYGNGFNPLTLE